MILISVLRKIQGDSTFHKTKRVAIKIKHSESKRLEMTDTVAKEKRSIEQLEDKLKNTSRPYKS